MSHFKELQRYSSRERVSRIGNMTRENNKPCSFPLRLPFSIRRQANDLAQKDGLSLNQFISLAVAEKITRLEHLTWVDRITNLDLHGAVDYREVSTKD
jgi:hypothetical protein